MKRSKCKHEYFISDSIDELGNGACAECGKWVYRFPDNGKNAAIKWLKSVQQVRL